MCDECVHTSADYKSKGLTFMCACVYMPKLTTLHACPCIYTCVHGYMHGGYTKCVCVCVTCTCLHVCRLQVGHQSSSWLSTYFLRQILNVPKMDSWVSLASLGGQCSPGTHLSLPTPSGRVTEMFHCTQLFMWALAGQTQVCAAGTFPTEPSSPQPQTTG